jgi:secreted Zn-dependent insulinase-like peptidase
MRHWANEIATHKYVFDRQDKECAMLKDLTLKEFKHHFEAVFDPKNMRRIDMHWNSKPHKVQEDAAAHIVDHYPTGKKEKKHLSLPAFKQSMGLYPDVYKANFARY